MANFLAASASRTDVNAKIALASPGDFVFVPAGTVSWAGGISLNGVNLIGAGSSGSGTNITDGAVTMTKHSSQLTRLSSVRFTGVDQHVHWTGNATDRPVQIDNNYFFTNGAQGVNQMLLGNANGAVIWLNTFEAATGINVDVFQIFTSEADWTDPNGTETMGNADTTGERNIYFELNTWNKIADACIDADIGARLVCRHNTFNDSGIVLHSSNPNDSGAPGDGHRHTEVYNNTFNRIDTSFSVGWWVWWRGGAGIFANNAMDPANFPPIWTAGHDISMTVGCPTAYPIDYQLGQIKIPSENPPSLPLLIFGNTETDGVTPYTLDIGIGEGPIVTCATPTSYIQVNRDYYLSNQWGWVPYTYPHPLATAVPTYGGVTVSTILALPLLM